jgi:transcriptional antiterminator NusG
MEISTDKKWYALHVPGGREDKVKEMLEKHLNEYLGFHVLKRVLKERKDGKWNKIERNLFPGYILVNGNIDNEVYYKINEFNRVKTRVNLLKNGRDLLTIDDEELRVLGLLTHIGGDTISISSIYRENDRIQVIEGPLTGLEGLILSVNKRKFRAKVSLDFIGQKRVVDLGIKMVEKV